LDISWHFNRRAGESTLLWELYVPWSGGFVSLFWLTPMSQVMILLVFLEIIFGFIALRKLIHYQTTRFFYEHWSESTAS
jgi:hypothetical protein